MAESPALPDLVTPRSGERDPQTAERPSIHGMKAQHHIILMRLLCGESAVSIAQDLGYTAKRVTDIKNSSIFKARWRDATQHAYETIVNGEMGPIAQARAATGDMVNGLLALARGARSENVKRLSCMDVLALGGHKPVDRTETLAIDKLITRMTEPELEHYVKTREWPSRFGNELRNCGRDVVIAKDEPIDVTPVPEGEI